jgi:hypothetical protein
MALPVIVVILSLAFGYGFPNSISATYFVPSCVTPFMIILGSAGVLLMCYRGYNIVDNLLNTAAGIFAWCICLFPCAAKSGNIGTFQLMANTSDIIHMISALLFFGILAYNSLFQFTKGSDNPTPNKKKRNIIFRICGIGMALSFVFMVPVMMLGIYGGIWAIETVALFFFGISWLTKANCYYWLFADQE